ncbi:anthranilate phosphoribosyltransferase [Prosthecochloris sp. ZM]|uniref:Anthranilate phosphoribosyltransferase n=2 Tax=Chlorobiaceae TaxID=191412 RepID=B4S7J5_PROA2|nr:MULTISPECIES: anthranilate phosphoribosyltransferase [Prosthecochloris]ACF46032.1 anthranilate phosphoribosyltransferase [Prosthecochloris aestuarii DSM 271]RDD31556.1 anthranilate phosphoribosyltransferase [Prosthecochloris sp. ZM]
MMSTEQELRAFGRLISAISGGHVMSREEAFDAYRQVILNLQPELQQGAFLSAHFMRKPSIEELSGAWDAIDTYDTAKVTAKIDGPVCDIVGTGSDPLKTLNCSSPAALIVAACGLPVAKKGARLVTGVSGASDIFESLGVDLDAPLACAERSLNEAGICYLPGEAFLQSGWARLIASMRFTTAFNILGPLTRPCGENNCTVIGAYAPEVSDTMIRILLEVGIESALSPYGMVDGKDPKEGIDEFSPCGPTRVVELRDGKIEEYHLTPEDFGVKPCRFEAIASGMSARENADSVLEVLEGNYDSSAADFFCMNASAALYCAGVAGDYRQGTAMAREALATGKASRKLEELIEYQGSAASTSVCS